MSKGRAGSRDPLVELFLDLARISSPSGSERRIADFLMQRLVASGLEAEESEPLSDSAESAGNIYCRVPGKLDSVPILLSAHMDTVFSDPDAQPEPLVENRIIRSGSRAVLGADNKASIAAIIRAVETVISEDRPHAGIELMFTVCEENGLKGAKSASLAGVEADCGFCMDSVGPVGEVIVRSPAQKTIRATFKGKSAHAGVAPEEGQSAVVAASLAVSEMRLGRIDDETTANIGIMKGGEAVNVVPDRCFIAGECRSHDPVKLEKQVTSMLDTINFAAADKDVDVDLSVVDEFHSFDLSEGNLPVDIASSALDAIGFKPILTATGGGSDVNEFNRKGLPSVNLSVGMQKVHTPEEFITLESLDAAYRLVLSIIDQAGSFE